MFNNPAPMAALTTIKIAPKVLVVFPELLVLPVALTPGNSSAPYKPFQLKLKQLKKLYYYYLL